MNRYLRRGAVLVAMTTACIAMLPVAASHAVLGPMNMSPCDNIDSSAPRILNTSIPLPGGIGTLDVLIQLGQDNYVRYDGPGTAFDTLVGADLQTISLADNTAVCVVLPTSTGVVFTVNPINLFVEVCVLTGQNPYTLGPCIST